MNLHDPDQFRRLWETLDEDQTEVAQTQPPQSQSPVVPRVHREIPLGETDVLDRRAER